jgi:hypothetical protein
MLKDKYLLLDPFHWDLIIRDSDFHGELDLFHFIIFEFEHIKCSETSPIDFLLL